MKKIIIVAVTVAALLAAGIFAYSSLNKNKQNENAKIEAESKLDPDVLKGIFDLATEKCYFSNVAEGEKTKKVLLAKKSIKYWVEYTETIEIKVDLTKSKFGQKNNNNKTYVVYIPEAEVDINSATIDENGTNVYVEKQGIIKVSVTAKDIEEAIKEANEDTIKNLKDKDDILYKAREKAKDYVKAYIKAFDIEDKFNVEFVDTVEEFDKEVKGDDIIIFETQKIDNETESKERR